MSRPRVGVLAMQGGVVEHVRALAAVGADAREVRTRADLDDVDGLVLPGGESTAIRRALHRTGLLEPLRERLQDGMPTFGTCAGLVVLARAAPDGAPATFGVLDVEVERNGWGTQVQSFERPVELDLDRGAGVAREERSVGAAPGVFIRAPRIVGSGADVEVVGRLAPGHPAAGEAVAVRQGVLLASTFHPELTDDHRLHAAFVASVTRR